MQRHSQPHTTRSWEQFRKKAAACLKIWFWKHIGNAMLWLPVSQATLDIYNAASGDLQNSLAGSCLPNLDALVHKNLLPLPRCSALPVASQSTHGAAWVFPDLLQSKWTSLGKSALWVLVGRADLMQHLFQQIRGGRRADGSWRKWQLIRCLQQFWQFLEVQCCYVQGLWTAPQAHCED